MLTKQYISKCQKSVHFYWITCRDSQSSDIGYGIAAAQRYLSLWFLEENECILQKKPEHYEVLSISAQDTVFQVEYSVWKLLLWLVHMEFPIQNQYIHTAKRTSNKNICETEHFTLNPGEYPKISVLITMWKHNLNVMKLWMPRNTWKSLQWKDFSKTSFILKSEHFLWSQLQYRIKSWNYVLEFKCSQNNTFQNTRKVTISIELLIEIFKSQIQYAKPTITHTALTTNWLNFWKRMQTILPKELNNLKTLCS